jgi:DNA-binding MarR family transcriptional regulator
MDKKKSDQKKALEQFLVDLQTINRYLRRGSLMHEDKQLTRVQWLILRYVARSERCTIGQLAEHLNVRPSTMSQMLDRLERERLLYRMTDETDTRAKIVRLTQEGEALIHRVESLWIEKLSGPFAQLTADEQRVFLTLLGKVANSISKSEGET